MNCPLCRQDTFVLKKLHDERRRECTACKHRFVTVEILKEDHRRNVQVLEDVRELAEKVKATA